GPSTQRVKCPVSHRGVGSGSCGTDQVTLYFSTHCVDRYPTQQIQQPVKTTEGKNRKLRLSRLQNKPDVYFRLTAFRHLDHTLKCKLPSCRIVRKVDEIT
ncbi:hypothetical protein AVEN_203283-1, partial [Araneus ventricosus]